VSQAPGSIVSDRSRRVLPCGERPAAASHELRIAPQGRQPLDQERQQFNRLLERIDGLRRELGEWQAFCERHRSEAGRKLLALLDEFAVARRKLIMLCDELLSGRRAGVSARTERLQLAAYLCDLCLAHLAERPAEPSVREIHDRYSNTAIAEREAPEPDFNGVVAKPTVGIGNAADLAAGTVEASLAASAAQAEEAERRAWEAREAQRRARHAARASRRDEQRAAAAEQAAREVSQSVRDVYRKLASALHPDRAVDECDRARRHELMQRGNAAYETSDLFGLLTLQLEVEQIDAIISRRSRTHGCATTIRC
jgi:hypothetical protein